MKMYYTANTLAHYLKLCYYYAHILVRLALLMVLTPVNFLVEALHSVVSDWEVSKPERDDDDDDYYNDPNNLGI